jgi:uncharacterized membrane protein
VPGTHLVALLYDDAAAARRALAALTTLADEHAFRLEDAAVVVRDEHGGVGLEQAHRLAAGEGIVGGGTLGLLIGLVVGFPAAGALVGMAGGGGVSRIDTGISDDEMRRVGAHLEAGRAALFALLAKVDWAHVRRGLEPYGGELIASEVTDDVVDALGSTGP